MRRKAFGLNESLHARVTLTKSLIQIEFVKPAGSALDPFESLKRELQSPMNIRRLK